MRKRRKKSTENGRMAVEGLGAIGLIHAAPSATGRGPEKRAGKGGWRARAVPVGGAVG
jgi:hypothetical protein